ncbi:MAG: glycosyltransferase family 4 protein [Desulfobulbaceae bacterium]
MKLAIIWSRFGAYHLARLRGAASVGLGRGAGIVGVEIARQDHYKWEVREGADGFERITLFPDAAYDELRVSRIRKAVKRLLDEIRPDVVAVNGWSVAEARAAIAWCGKRPKAKAILMSETKQDEGEKRAWWKELIKRWLVGQCDAALVGGRPHAAYLRHLGFPPERIFLGYDVVDNEYFARESVAARVKDGENRRRYNLPERYFFACTRFLPRKNIAGLLHAYAAYRSRTTSPWGLVIAGDGEELEALQVLESSLGLDDVHWPGFLRYRELPVYFGLARAFIHPALSEPWGLVVNEAAACGLPLLVSETVGARYELVEDGANGILFDPKSRDAMAGAMLRVSGMSDAERAAMGRRSCGIVSEWGPERFGQGVFDAMDVAIGRDA